MRNRAAFAILSGDRADGTQQRLRYGLGEHVPYRWHGKPDWNPARVLDGWRSVNRMARACVQCGAIPGEQCRTRTGHHTRSSHVAR